MFRDEAAITRALALPFGGEVSPATGLDILAAALSNPDARDAMWATLKEAFPFLLQTFGGTGVVPLVLQWSVPYLGLGREQEVREFFAHLDVGEGRAGLTKGLDLLGIYAAVRSRFASYDGA